LVQRTRSATGRNDAGICRRKYLYELGRTRDARWQAYLEALERLGQSREPKGRT
jgi:DUF971 family protein